VVSTHLKNTPQIGNLPQVVGEKKKDVKPPPSLNIDLRHGKVKISHAFWDGLFSGAMLVSGWESPIE